MTAENPFDYKYVEKILFSTYRSQLPPGRKTRSYLRRMSRYIEKAWEIGYRDSTSGKPMIQQEELPELPSDSPLARGITRRAYVAYESGYRAGAKEV